jgi:hypothetical protein
VLSGISGAFKSGRVSLNISPYRVRCQWGLILSFRMTSSPQLWVPLDAARVHS